MASLTRRRRTAPFAPATPAGGQSPRTTRQPPRTPAPQPRAPGQDSRSLDQPPRRPEHDQRRPDYGQQDAGQPPRRPDQYPRDPAAYPRRPDRDQRRPEQYPRRPGRDQRDQDQPARRPDYGPRRPRDDPRDLRRPEPDSRRPGPYPRDPASYPRDPDGYPRNPGGYPGSAGQQRRPATQYPRDSRQPGPPGQAAPPGRPSSWPGRGPRRSPAPGESDASLLRSSGGMALGTLASRITGFLRTLLLAYAIGSADLGNAYNDANTLPNVVYDLMLGGILTSVVVPLLVAAARRDPDRGEGYFQRIFTLGVMALGAITLVATLAAALIVDLYAGSIPGAERHVMVVFAYFFIPQIFFYGVSSLAGAILNARGRFAAPMWTPVINNVVVILILLMYVAVAGLGHTPANITPGEVRLLGIGTTLGIIAQTAALLPALLRSGFRPRPTFSFRRAEIAEIGRMAGWLAGYVVTTQVAFFTTVRVANNASVHAPTAGFSAYTYAYQLFQMPYAIVGISVITALLPRMAAHASARRYSRVRADFSTGVRLSSVIVVPSALLLAVLGGPLAEMLFRHGSTTLAGAHYIGDVFSVFALGLVPYMTFQLLLRVFYSLHDSRTPFFIGVATMTTSITLNVIALTTLPAAHVVEGLAASFGLANLVGAILAWRLLIRRVGSLDGRAITRSLVKMYVAAIPAALFALEMGFAVGVVIHPGFAYGLVTVLLGGGGGLLLYVLFARGLHLREIANLMATIGGRFGGRRAGPGTRPLPPGQGRGGPAGRRRR